MNATVQMPELTGSPKQVSWAQDIRQRRLDGIDAREPVLRAGTRLGPDQDAAELAALDAARTFLAYVTNAKTLINGRDWNTPTFVQLFVIEPIYAHSSPDELRPAYKAMKSWRKTANQYHLDNPGW
ncbi:MAG: hypothetical protein ACRDFS_02055 [Chloroflexota bacterium]